MVTGGSIARLGSTLSERLRGKLRSGLRAARGMARRYQVVYNVNAADESRHRRRALLLYRVMPFVLSEVDPEFFRHHSVRRCKQIAANLGELGYVVDAANGHDARFRRPPGRYDAVISDVASTRGFFPKGTKTILLATMTNPVVHNQRLRRRHELLARRRGCSLRAWRIYKEAMPYAVRADAIIVVGNFTSRDQVQRGLDLLLEVFPRQPDLHLYVCSMFDQETDFCACYRKELYETPNLHPIGWVPIHGSRFHELVRRCAYVILPTCSEGQSGSVVQCMHAGLIPLVTREAGIDTEGFGVTFAGDGLEEIERVIVDVAHRPEGWHRAYSLSARRAAETAYSEEAFQRRWREILGEILGHEPDSTDRGHAPSR